jgi:arsenate reductase
MVTIYGIRNCDTCRAALKWLAAEGMAHHFHDLRQDGLDAAKLDNWIAAIGWEKLLNRRSTTWRALSAAAKDSIDGPSARALMLDQPTLIKRPVFALGDICLVGFGDDQRETLSQAAHS